MDYADEEEEREENGLPKIRFVEVSKLDFVLLAFAFLFGIAILAVQFLTAPGYEFTDPGYSTLPSEPIVERSVVSDESSSEEDDVFPIKINTADYEQLQKIPGIGPVMAQKIIKYRRQYGTIVEIDELLSIDGIGKKTVEVLKEYCIVN